MKLIGAVQGHSALRVSPEEVAPRNGTPWLELTEALNSRYKFQSASTAPLNPPAPSPAWTMFQNGEFQVAEQKIAIQQLILTDGAMMVIASTTEAADAILGDLIVFLDRSFEFRISSSPQKRNHVSDVVVQFDRGIEEYISVVERMQTAIGNALSKNSPRSPKVSIKAITFGSEPSESAVLNAGGPLDGIDTVDFLMERRVRHAYSENRYYCRAPLQTEEHIELLQAIEEIARAT